MTDLNINISNNKNFLLSLVAKPIFINGFNLPERYFSIPAGIYLIDAVIFHFDGQIELGISEYDQNILPENFDIDKAHIGYFNLNDLEINYESTSIPSLINHQAA